MDTLWGITLESSFVGFVSFFWPIQNTQYVNKCTMRGSLSSDIVTACGFFTFGAWDSFGSNACHQSCISLLLLFLEQVTVHHSFTVSELYRPHFFSETCLQGFFSTGVFRRWFLSSALWKLLLLHHVYTCQSMISENNLRITHLNQNFQCFETTWTPGRVTLICSIIWHLTYANVCFFFRKDCIVIIWMTWLFSRHFLPGV